MSIDDPTGKLYVAYFTPSPRDFIQRVFDDMRRHSQEAVSALREIDAERNQQRANVQTKRHKSKTFHVQKKKEVPAFLKKLTKDL